jgi:hypothetical protein
MKNESKKIFLLIKSIKNLLAIKHRVYNEFTSHKVTYFCVWSMNLDYLHEINNYSETKSLFSKDYISCISDQTYFIKKSLIEFQWRKNNISSPLNLIVFKIILNITWDISKTLNLNFKIM